MSRYLILVRMTPSEPWRSPNTGRPAWAASTAERAKELLQRAKLEFIEAKIVKVEK